LFFKLEYLAYFDDVSTTIQQLAVTHPSTSPLDMAFLAIEVFFDAYRGFKMTPVQLMSHLKFESTMAYALAGGMQRSRLMRYVDEALHRKHEELHSEVAALKASLLTAAKRGAGAQAAPGQNKKARVRGTPASVASSAATTPAAASQTVLPPADQIALAAVRKLCYGFCHSLFVDAGICHRYTSTSGCKFEHDNVPALTAAQKVIMEAEVRRVRG
jgi:hypothetical protein